MKPGEQREPDSMHVLLTGGGGMLGRAIRRLAPGVAPHWTILAPSHRELDLTNHGEATRFIGEGAFDLVVHAAARVGGIAANIADPIGFMLENLEINTNVIGSAREHKVPALLFAGSSCMYPKDSPDTLKEEHLLSGPLEPTNEGYALSKITGAKLCEYIASSDGLAYRTLIPCNLYGPGDHFEPERSHLVAAVLHKLHQAKISSRTEVEIWGDGTARREFLYVDDLARFILKSDAASLGEMPQYLNVGYGEDYSVADYYRMGAEAVGYSGSFTHNMEAPTGMKRKLMDSRRAQSYRWSAPTPPSEGLVATYQDYLARISADRASGQQGLETG